MVPEIEKKAIGRGAAYIYVETIGSIISGYIFWIVMSKIATTEIIGISSAMVSFATIMAVIANIGIPTGVQRFIGRSFSEKKIEDTQAFVLVSLVLMFIGITSCSVSIVILQNWIHDSLRFDSILIIISILLIGSSATSMLFRSVVISSLKTQSLPIIIISSSLIKMVISIILVLLGTGAVGLTLGLAFNHVFSSIFLAVVILRTVFMTSQASKFSVKFIHNSKNILHSSIVFWIPFLITILGSQLGTIVVFGSQGSNQAAVYFLALTIVTGLMSVMNSLFSIALPALSALHDYRKRFAWQTIRMSAIILVPISSSVLFYSEQVMQLLGKDYVKGATSLEILLLSMLPMAILSGVNALVYSYGNYRQVLIIGLAMSLPRVALYFALVPAYSGIGAAIGYTLGTIIGCIVSIVIAKKIGLVLFWKDLVFIFFIPTAIAFCLSYLQFNFILGITATVIFSYIIMLKLHVVTITDVRDSLDVLPDSLSTKIVELINKFHK